MQKELSKKMNSLRKMIGKKAHVTCGSGWVGYVSDVVDEHTLNVTKVTGKVEEVSIFDIRSV
mgnify:CR=1 FL=1